MNSQKEKQELIKIGFVTLLGLVSLFAFVFWLKGHKFHYYAKYSFYFKNVNGLEPGAALNWNGLKIGVVEKVTPVLENTVIDMLPAEALINLGKEHLILAQKSIKGSIEDLVFARENLNKAQLEIALGKLAKMQSNIRKGEHVRVDVVVTLRDVPIGPLNQVTIVPSGLIGEQYVDITTIDISEKYAMELIDRIKMPQFVVLEPIRLDRLLRVNVESSESIRDLANRVNAIFRDEDATSLRVVLNSVKDIAADTEFRDSVKESAQNIKTITEDFNIWKLLFPAKKKPE